MVKGQDQLLVLKYPPQYVANSLFDSYVTKLGAVVALRVNDTYRFSAHTVKGQILFQMFSTRYVMNC